MKSAKFTKEGDKNDRNISNAGSTIRQESSSRLMLFLSGCIPKLKNLFTKQSGKAEVEAVESAKFVDTSADKFLSVNAKVSEGWNFILESPFSEPSEYKEAIGKALGVSVGNMDDAVTEACTDLFREWYNIFYDSETLWCIEPTNEDYFWRGQCFFSYSDKVFDETLKERFIASIQRFELATGLHPDKERAVERIPHTIFRGDAALDLALSEYTSVSDISGIMDRAKIEEVARERISREGMAFLNKRTCLTNDTARHILSGKMYKQLKEILKDNTISINSLTVNDVIALKEGRSVSLESGYVLTRHKEIQGYGFRISQPAKQHTPENQPEM